jgi:chemosensory pili system protein ChpA (sensor histidine kinase/response regulator)
MEAVNALNYPHLSEAELAAAASRERRGDSSSDNAASPAPFASGTGSPSQASGKRRDLSALAWLAPSLRAALDDAAAEFGNFIDEVQQTPDALGARDTTSLRLAGQQLHQAAGAVHIVGLRGVDTYTQSLRRLLEAVDAGKVAADANVLNVFRLGVTALAEYVDDLMAGDDEDPLRLFRSYADVLACLGEERIHPADLWSDDLHALPAIVMPMRMASGVTRARQRFESALLQALRLPDGDADPVRAQEAFLPLQSALDDVRACEHEPRRASDDPDRSMWHVLALVFGALAHGLLPVDLLAKRLSARTHLLLRQYVQGQVRVPQGLLTDALYQLVRTGLTAPRPGHESDQLLGLRLAIRQCLHAFRVEAAHAVARADHRQRYHGWLDAIDTANLQQAAAALTHSAKVDAPGTWQTALAALAVAAHPLDQPALLRCLDAAARHAGRHGDHGNHGYQGHVGGLDSGNPALAASGIALFLSQTLALPWRVHGKSGHAASALFGHRCAELANALDAGADGSAPAWLAEMVEAARAQTVRQEAVARLRGLLDGGESWLDAFDRERDSGKSDGAEHLRDARQAFEGVAASLRAVEQAGAMPAALRTDAATIAKALRAADQHLGALQEAPVAGGGIAGTEGTEGNQPAAGTDRADRLAAIAAELGSVHAFVDALEFGGSVAGRNARPEPDFSGLGLFEPGATDTPLSVAQVLLAQARAAAGKVVRGVPTPDSAEVRALRAALRAMGDQAGIDDDAGLRKQADLATTQLNAWLAGSDGSAERLVVALADHAPLPGQGAAPLGVPAPAPAPVPESGNDFDAELLDIFLTEATEVLADIGTVVASGDGLAHGDDTLYRLRRAFHTLKGSSRMVGLNRFGDAAWAVEQVMNLWIAEARDTTDPLLGLLRHAHVDLSAWTESLREHAGATRDVSSLLAAAGAVRNGTLGGDGQGHATIGMPEAAESAPTAQDADDGTGIGPAAEDESADASHVVGRDADVTVIDLGSTGRGEVVADESDQVDEADGVDGVDGVDGADEAGVGSALDAPTGVNDAVVIPFPFADDLSADDDHYKVIGPARISLPLYNVYLQEADSLVRQIGTDISEWHHENRPCPSELALRVVHTLQGSAATVGLEPVREIAEAMERLLLQLNANPVAMHPGDFRLLEQSVDRVRGMLHQFAAGIWPSADAALCRSLGELGERAMFRPRIQIDTARAATPADAGAPVAMLFGQNRFAASTGSGTGFGTDFGTDGGTESGTEPDIEPDTGLANDSSPVPVPAGAGEARVSVANVSPAPPMSALEREAAQLDMVLVEIFLEEAQGSLPELGKLLRVWEAMSDDLSHAGLILRALHTLKGSARMAGAMALGQAAHEMETLVDAAARVQRTDARLFARLYAWYDRILAHGEALQGGKLLALDDADFVNGLGEVAAAEREHEIVDEAAADPAAVPMAGAVAAAAADAAPPAPSLLPAIPVLSSVPARAEVLAPAVSSRDIAERQRAQVRVQARTLDTLINDAGEVGASRARLESELEALRSYLGELNDNVGRLRGQLREIEIQAESQMASRIADASHQRDFDPLEFDRFTRFQELTRMMAESVNDVATVEQNLQRGFDRAADSLDAQARLTRGLQRSLMQARMVQFDTLAERLYRVARQAASETGKDVRLLIKGGTVEIDRSVLDRMGAPIEHLIRNAVVHGIESADVRRAAGKPAQGGLTLEVQQEGNEVVLHFVDDGGGLDLPRIRERAIARQLLAAGEDASDARLTEMIFTPGFSTADQISELAGRGVGMDVVRAETVALGGRIVLSTEPGRGTRFTVHLPLTTAITQVLLVTLGGRLFAIPSGMIEQVQQLRSPALLDAYNRGRVATPTGDVPFHYFGTLLEEASAIASGRRYAPIVVVRSGAERVGVHVDDVVGNREVVVKHIGPHLARLDGIAGATTLGDGEIVLIYNPVVLAQRHVRERGATLPQRLPPGLRIAAPGETGQLGAIAELDGGVGGVGGGAVPVSGLRTQPSIMVVDDSLTVRKATHRLLTRAGYQVVLARDGVDALKQMQDAMPDAMLVDIEMPHMDGFDLTRNVRADPRTAQMPIVIISSRTAEKHRRYATEIGVNVFLGKPYNEDEVLTTLHQLIGERAAGTSGSVAEMLQGSGE